MNDFSERALAKAQKKQSAKVALRKMVKNVQRTHRTAHLTQPQKLRILSIDGGGIRAILPAVLLAKLEERLQTRNANPQARIVDCFDLVAGTSAGGILTSMYLTPSAADPTRPKYSAMEVLESYLADGCESFTQANPDAAQSRTEKYCASILESKLQTFLGAETRLDQLVKPTLITAYNLETEMPVFFESWKVGSYKAWQVARATSAAPGMFKPARYAKLEDGHPLIDGSIFAASPALCAYTSASHPIFLAGKAPIMLSIGTGKSPKVSAGNTDSWLRVMVKNLMSSGPVLVDQQLRQLFSTAASGYYCRLNPGLPANYSTIDDVRTDHVDSLYQLATQYFSKQEAKIDRLLTSLLGR